MSHTQGPWKRVGRRIIGADGKQIGEFFKASDYYKEHQERFASDEEGEGNVSLMVLGPEFLALCVELEHNLKQGAICEEDIRALRAIIAKATGREGASS